MVNAVLFLAAGGVLAYFDVLAPMKPTWDPYELSLQTLHGSALTVVIPWMGWLARFFYINWMLFWFNLILIGFPMVDMKVTLYDGAFHEVDSSAIAFEIATRAAMKEACEKGGVKLLEPIMDVEVVTPGDFVGGVIGDINSRRGQIRDQQMRGNATVVRAFVPLANARRTWLP